MNEQSTGLVKHSLCNAEEEWINDDSRGHTLTALSCVETTDQQGDSLHGARKN